MKQICLILKPEAYARREEMEKDRKKILSDLKEDGIAIIPAGYEVIRCELEEIPPYLEVEGEKNFTESPT